MRAFCSVLASCSLALGATADTNGARAELRAVTALASNIVKVRAAETRSEVPSPYACYTVEVESNIEGEIGAKTITACMSRSLAPKSVSSFAIAVVFLRPANEEERRAIEAGPAEPAMPVLFVCSGRYGILRDPTGDVEQSVRELRGAKGPDAIRAWSKSHIASGEAAIRVAAVRGLANGDPAIAAADLEATIRDGNLDVTTRRLATQALATTNLAAGIELMKGLAEDGSVPNLVRADLVRIVLSRTDGTKVLRRWAKGNDQLLVKVGVDELLDFARNLPLDELPVGQYFAEEDALPAELKLLEGRLRAAGPESAAARERLVAAIGAMETLGSWQFMYRIVGAKDAEPLLRDLAATTLTIQASKMSTVERREAKAATREFERELRAKADQVIFNRRSNGGAM